MLQFSMIFVQLSASTLDDCLYSSSGTEQSQSSYWNGLVQFQVWTKSSISKLKPAVLSYSHIQFTITIIDTTISFPFWAVSENCPSATIYSDPNQHSWKMVAQSVIFQTAFGKLTGRKICYFGETAVHKGRVAPSGKQQNLGLTMCIFSNTLEATLDIL